MPFDLLIKGGHVPSPGDNLDGALEIGISEGRIVAIGADLPIGEAKQAIEIRGTNRYVHSTEGPHARSGVGQSRQLRADDAARRRSSGR